MWLKNKNYKEKCLDDSYRWILSRFCSKVNQHSPNDLLFADFPWGEPVSDCVFQQWYTSSPHQPVPLIYRYFCTCVPQMLTDPRYTRLRCLSVFYRNCNLLAISCFLCTPTKRLVWSISLSVFLWWISIGILDSLLQFGSEFSVTLEVLKKWLPYG